MLLFGVSGTRRRRPMMPKRIVVWLLLATTVNKIAGDVGASSFQLVRVTSDFVKVGRDHVTGEVSAEVRMAPEVTVQAFWSKVIWNENNSVPSNYSSHAIRYYDVPITGDAWCTINDVIWVETFWRHMTSSLKCRHLPNDNELSLILSLRSLDGSAQLRTPIRLFSESPSSHNWFSPLVYPVAIQRPKTRTPLELVYSFEMRRFPADVNFTVTLTTTWENDTETTFSLFSSAQSNISTNQTYIIFLDGMTCTHVTTGSMNTLRLTTSRFDPAQHGHRWVISIQLSDRDYSQTLDFSTDFIPQPPPPPLDSSHYRPHRLHIRACSGGGGDVNRTATSGREFHFRFRRPDCIVCEAFGWPSSAPPRPPQMEVRRVADGPSLGTEETHSVFYHRVSYLTSALVFVVRSPAEEYSGEYECIAGKGDGRTQLETRIRFRIEIS